jgi:hypothetical protein
MSAAMERFCQEWSDEKIFARSIPQFDSVDVLSIVGLAQQLQGVYDLTGAFCLSQTVPHL